MTPFYSSPVQRRSTLECIRHRHPAALSDTSAVRDQGASLLLGRINSSSRMAIDRDRITPARATERRLFPDLHARWG